MGERGYLKLHADDRGMLWALAGRRPPQPLGLPAHRLAEWPGLCAWRRVRLVGCPANAGLVVELADARADGRLERLELAGPLSCPTARARREPALVLLHLVDLDLPACAGGWAELAPAEVAAYRLAAAAQAGDEDATLVRRWLRPHPAWPALAPLGGGLDLGPVVRVLARLLAPRFWVHPARPDSVAPAEEYLGLRRPYAERRARGQRPEDRRTDCRMAWGGLVASCWSGSGLFPAEDPARPAWQVELAGSRRFLRCLLSGWRAALAGRADLYTPERYLGEGELARRCRAALAAWLALREPPGRRAA